MANPFENILHNLYSNSIFAKPKQQQLLDATEALRQSQAASVARGMTTMGEIATPGKPRQQALREMLANKGLMADLLVSGDIKPDSIVNLLNAQTNKPTEQTTLNQGDTAFIPGPDGSTLVPGAHVPAKAESDAAQAAANAKLQAPLIKLISETQGMPRVKAWKKITGSKEFQDYLAGGGEMKDVVSAIEGVTVKPFEQTTSAPGSRVTGPDPEGNPQTILQMPTAGEQDYEATSRLLGPDTATELLRIGGFGDKTEKQRALAQLVVGQTDPKKKEYIRTLGAGLIAGTIIPQTQTDFRTGRTYNALVDATTGAVVASAPVGALGEGNMLPSGTSPDPSVGGQTVPQPMQMNGQQGTVQPQQAPSQNASPYVPRSDLITQAPPVMIPGTSSESFQPQYQPIVTVPAKYSGIISAVEQSAGLPRGLLARQIFVESGFNPNARGKLDERGLMQLRPGTWREVGVKNPDDPQENIAGGGLYMSQLMEKYQGNVAYALAGYNWGQGNVDRWLQNGGDPKKMPRMVKDYISKIIGPDQATDALFPDVASAIKEMQPIKAPGQLQLKQEGPDFADNVQPVESSDELRIPPSKAAVFGSGPMPSFISMWNNWAVPLGLGLTDHQVQDSRNSMRMLRQSLRDFLEFNGRELNKAEADKAMELLPQDGIAGFFQSKSDAVSKLIELHGYVERVMNQAAETWRTGTGPNHPDAVKQALNAYKAGEIFLSQLGTVAELRAAKKNVDWLERQPMDFQKEVLNRMETLISGNPLEALEPESDTSLSDRLKTLESQKAAEQSAAQGSPEMKPPTGSQTPKQPGFFQKLFQNDNEGLSDEQLIQKMRDINKQGSYDIPGSDMRVTPAGQDETPQGKAREMSKDEQIANIRAEIDARKIAKESGVPRQIVDFGLGFQRELADTLNIPIDVVRTVIKKVGAARILSEKWQSDKSTEEITLDNFRRAGYHIDSPDTLSATFGKGAFEGGMLASGLLVTAPRLAAIKGPGAVKAIVRTIGKSLTDNKAGFVAGSMTGGGSSAVSDTLTTKAGIPQPYKGAIDFAAGVAGSGPGTMLANSVKSAAKIPGQIIERFTPPKAGPLRNPNSEGATAIKDYAEFTIAKNAKKKTALSTFLEKDADKAVTSIMEGKNPAAGIQSLKMNVLRDPEVREAIPAAALDWLFRKTKVDQSTFNPEDFAAVWNNPPTRRAMAAALPRETFVRIEKIMAAEKTLMTGGPAKLRPMRTAGAAALGAAAGGPLGAVAGAGIYQGTRLVAKILGSTLMKSMGFKTLIAQSAGAKSAQGAAIRMLSKIIPIVPPSVLMREALLSPKSEKQLLIQLRKISDEFATVRSKRATRITAGLQGTGRGIQTPQIFGEEDDN